MPSKKSVAPGTPAPSKSSCQRTLTNKQQQLRKIVSSYLVILLIIIFFSLVAQKKEKEEAAQQRALTDAIRAEQRQEEVNGFRKTKLPGDLSSMRSMDIFNLFLKMSFLTMMILRLSRKTMAVMMNHLRWVLKLSDKFIIDIYYSGLFERNHPSSYQDCYTQWPFFSLSHSE